MAMLGVTIGIIGGTGMTNLDMFKVDQVKEVSTPFGKPSSSLTCGQLNGINCVLLNRHGNLHQIPPSRINYRANIFALKQEGCTHIIATTACGSLKEQIAPGHFVILDQFIDRTYRRDSTFYDGTVDEFKGICHIPMKQPFCSNLADILIKSCQDNGIKCHPEGTAVTIEGPRFSTFAESKLFQSWGASIVNMTTVPEVVLANELGVLYAAVAMVTDYDCWKENECVNVENVMLTMKENREQALKIVVHAVSLVAQGKWEKNIEDAAYTSISSVVHY